MRAALRILLFVLLWRALSILFDLFLIPPAAWMIRAIVPTELLWLERALHFVFYLAAVLVALAVAARWIDRRRFADYATAATRDQGRDLLAGALLGLALMALIFTIFRLMGWLEVNERFFVNLPNVPFALAFLGPVLAFAVIALAEELIFRGYVLRNVAEGLHRDEEGGAAPTESPLPGMSARAAVLTAWLISSLLFGLFHIFNPGSTWASTVNLTLAGLMLGISVILTARLGFAVGLHFAWNLAQGTLFGFPVSGNDFAGVALLRTTLTGPPLWTGGAFGPEAGLLGLATLLAGSLLVLLWVQRRERSLRIAQSLAIYHRTGAPAR